MRTISLIVASIAVLASGSAWAVDREVPRSAEQRDTRDSLNQTDMTDTGGPTHGDPAWREGDAQAAKCVDASNGSGSGDPRASEERERDEARAQSEGERQQRSWTGP
jgi:hypothetical protein